MRLNWIVFCLALTAPALATEASYSPKILIRLDNGVVWNHGEAGGSTSSLGGVNLDYLLFFSPDFGLGFGYQINFDLSRTNVPLRGFDFFARYYFWGQGTRVRMRAHDMATEVRDGFAMYFAGGARQNSLLVREPLASTDSTVTSWNLNLGLGGDYRLSHGFDLTAELNLAPLSFADDNARYRLGSFLFKVGLNYLW